MSPSTQITLSQLQAGIKKTLSGEFSAPVWVVAEIGEMKVNHSSGHCYLELVEKGSANGVPKARAAAVIWRNSFGMISAYFSGATGANLSVGMKVLLKVAVSYHELYGLSLVVSDIDPMYTLGDMEEQRRKTIAQLMEDGVFDLNRELGFPAVPQRIAVVSSPGAAGFQDFMQELAASGYRFDMELFDAVMQGHGAEASIIDALGRIAACMDEFDAVVIIRGGGAQSDLGFLNSYELCFHLAQFPLPIVAGLGHDKDQSIADMVSAVSVKTPTAAAGFLAGRLGEFDTALENLLVDVRESAYEMIDDCVIKVDRLSSALSMRSVDFTRAMELRLARFGAELGSRAEKLTERRRARLDNMALMLRERYSRVVAGALHKLDSAAVAVGARDPQKILALGFAIVRQDGRVLRNAADVVPGSRLDITLGEGEITAKTEG